LDEIKEKNSVFQIYKISASFRNKTAIYFYYDPSIRNKDDHFATKKKLH